MLCESHVGYLSDFTVYTGADTVYPEPSIILSKPSEDYSRLLVLSLLEGFYNAGKNLTLYNPCTSPELLRVFFGHESQQKELASLQK